MNFNLTIGYPRHSFLFTNNKMKWICNILSNQWYQSTTLPKENPLVNLHFYPLVNLTHYQQIVESMDFSYNIATFYLHYIPIHFFAWSWLANPLMQYCILKENILIAKNLPIKKNLNLCKSFFIPSGQNTLFKWNLLNSIQKRQLFFLPFLTFYLKDVQTCQTFYSLNQQLHFTGYKKANEDKWCDTVLHLDIYKVNSYAVTSFLILPLHFSLVSIPYKNIY
uniref:Uncharacterized protein n=1 Tax=Jakoba libera TaxID=143017 RepID=M4QDL9_JAKLI|nr:hypothetical protein L048_p016 [Jakoba libera]AGH24240.1 hypothetical protein [Jakoba libera]